MDELDQNAAGLYSELKELKDYLHRHPERSFEEIETTKVVQEKLTFLELSLIDLGMTTGVVAVLDGGRPGKTVALRSDLDAIVQTEDEGHTVRSQVDGLMHGCGHDFHTACLYGAAKLLAAKKSSIAGRVVFLFQPAEEVTQGAQAMLTHGLWEKLGGKSDAVFGLHNRPELVAGKIAVLDGPIMAGKMNYRITLQGKSGHGGSPHKCIDPITAGAALTQSIQTIVSRSTDPLEALVCSVDSMHTDAPDFFVPTSLSMTGSIRYLNDAVGAKAAQRLQELTDGICAAHGCVPKLELIPQVPVTQNASHLVKIAQQAAQATVGATHVVHPQPDMGSEDFSVFGSEIPSFFYWLGSGFPDQPNAPWHSPRFQTNDLALPLGAALLARSALLTLSTI